ncbi:MAG TPA: universal stress protein [Dongiaceae bacterium]|nr:universal stress protein [Dongiaceae bacterium]
MTYKTILAAVSGGSASAGTVEIAARLARRFDAHLEGLHIRIDPIQILATSIDGMGMPLPTEWIEDMEKEAAATAQKTKALFDSALARQGLALSDKAPTDKAPGASATWRDETGPAADLVASRARFFDLAILGRSERVAGKSHSDAIEQVLIHAGCPVLLAPVDAPKEIGEKIAIGWNGSTEAVRTLHAALPLLAKAQTVTIVTVEAGADKDVAAVIAYLAWHGISASHRGTTLPGGVSPGEQLIATTRDIQADLLVMGAYGRAPWREVIFGGATRQVLQASMLPILMSH